MLLRWYLLRAPLPPTASLSYVYTCRLHAIGISLSCALQAHRLISRGMLIQFNRDDHTATIHPLYVIITPRRLAANYFTIKKTTTTTTSWLMAVNEAERNFGKMSEYLDYDQSSLQDSKSQSPSPSASTTCDLFF